METRYVFARHSHSFWYASKTSNTCRQEEREDFPRDSANAEKLLVTIAFPLTKSERNPIVVDANIKSIQFLVYQKYCLSLRVAGSRASDSHTHTHKIRTIIACRVLNFVSKNNITNYSNGV